MPQNHTYGARDPTLVHVVLEDVSDTLESFG